MPTLTDTQERQAIGRLLYPNDPDAPLTTLASIRMGALGDGSGEDAESVLLRKLDEQNLMEVRTDTPMPSATTKWFIYRSDERRLYIKTFDGSTYGYTPAFSTGDYQLRIIYHAAGTVTVPGITWNSANQTFNITSGAWSLTDTNAAWMRIIVLPANSDAASVSPAIRIGDPPASAIAYTRPNDNGLFPSAVSDVNEALDYVHENVSTAAQQPAAQAGLIQTLEYDSFTNNLLTRVGMQATQTFSIDEALTQYRSNYGEPLFIETILTAGTQATASGSPGQIRYRYEVVDGAGQPLSPPIRRTLTIQASNSEETGSIRLAGILPSNFSGGGLRTTIESNPSNLFGFRQRIRAEIRPLLNANEVAVSTDALGGNIADDMTLVDLEDVLEQVDSLPLELADEYDLEWPAPPNGIDDADGEVTRDLPLERLLGMRLNRPLQTFVAKIRYDSAFIAGSRTDTGTTVDFRHRITSDADNYTAELVRNDVSAQDATATTRTAEIVIPANTTNLRVGFTVTAGQFDAALAITNYDLDVEKGIDSSGFRSNLQNIRSVQSLAQAVNDGLGTSADAANIAINPTAWRNPNRFPGGVAEMLAAAFNVEARPDDVLAALQKIDVLLQLLDNPFEANQALDFGSTFEPMLAVTDSNVHRSNPIDVPQELRDLGVNIAIRVRIRLNAIDTAVRGRLSLVEGASPFDRVGDNVIVNGTLQSAGDHITFQRVIPAADVESTYRLQFQRTSSAGNVTFNRGVAYMVDSAASQTGGMGQAAAYSERNIWIAGGTVTSRLTNSSTQTLLAGHRFEDYNDLEFVFDNGPAAGQVLPMRITANNFLSSASYGAMKFTDLLGYLVRPIGSVTNQFTFIWGNNGLRRIIGINTV